MTWNHVRAIAGADLRRLFKSKDYWIPFAIIGTLFFVAIPFVSLSVISSAARTQFAEQVTGIVGNLPETLTESALGDTPLAKASYIIAVYLLAPIAIIVPLTISVAVGSNAIVGERERGTGEFLAHSPLTTAEIYTGKLIASLIPGFIATAAGFTAYALVVNLAAGSEFDGWFFPTAGWVILILWIVPPFLAVAIAVVLRMSARVRSAAAAQQASSLVTLPVILLSYAVATRVVASPGWSAFLIGLMAWVVAAILSVRGARRLRRERLLGVASET